MAATQEPADMPRGLGNNLEIARMEPDRSDEGRRLFFSALECQTRGRLAEAEGLYLQSLALVPDRLSTLTNLYIVMILQNRHDAAMPYIDRVLALNPGNELAWVHKAMWHSDQGRLEEALSFCDKAIAINRDSADAHHNRALILMKSRRFEEALAGFDRALGIKPDYAAAYQHRGNVLYALGRNEDAVASYRSAVANGLNTGELRYLLAALGADAAPSIAPADLVVNLFDKYADVFDQHLTSLHYNGPQVIFDKVSPAAPAAGWDIADLGCGTGLSGPLFRPIARTLIGVDLSANMIEKARERRSYDELIRGEITEFLRGRAASCFDLVIAADVFVYVGDLAPVFEAVRRALRPGGMFAFSVETHGGAGYVLQPHQHFAQSLSYVRDCAATLGFIEGNVTPLTIRKHRGKDIDGAIVVLIAPER